MAKKDKIYLKWNWKVFWIIVLAFLWILTSYAYIALEDEYNSYQQEVQRQISELQLELTKELGDVQSNYDCYERGTKECYDMGTVDCFVKGSVGEAEDKLEEFLRTNDCYERGTVYCYNEPPITSTCEEGYELRCVQN